MRVLIVEDEKEMQEILRRFLEPFTSKIVMTETLADGLAAMRRERFDIALLDLGLPDSRVPNTMQSIRTFKEIDPTCAVTVISGAVGEPGFESHMAEFGADAALHKASIMVSPRKAVLMTVLKAIQKHISDPTRTQSCLKSTERLAHTVEALITLPAETIHKT